VQTICWELDRNIDNSALEKRKRVINNRDNIQENNCKKRNKYGHELDQVSI
jgi:hypothetical protein